VGRLNYVAYVIPLSRHFLNRVRFRLKARKHKNQQELSLTQDELDDFELWLVFLAQARKGIWMNQITIRRPTKICWSDSCPFGIGGFLLSGRAWRIRIPDSSPIYGLDIANNVLEFLGMMVTIWLVLIECEQDCILALGDNTSAIGWLFKSGKLPFDSLHYKPVQLISRKLARLLTDSSHCLASQHNAQHVTTVFEDQKNGKKMDAPTHSRSGHKFLCPVTRWGSAVQRMIATIPGWNEQTTLCSAFLDGETIEIGNAFCQKIAPTHLRCCIQGFQNFWVLPSRDREQVPSVGSSYVPLPHGPLPCQNYDPWSLVLRCLLGLCSTTSPRVDQQHVMRHDPP
jgi:hypothetical protein